MNFDRHQSMKFFRCTLAITFTNLGLASFAQEFADPAPPEVFELESKATPLLAIQEELTFYRSPKPLPYGAITNDWKDFLGPTHNGVSKEMKLSNSFGESGADKLWEVSKGEGYASPSVIGERVVLFHRVGDESIIECLNAENGQQYWKTTYPTSYRDRYGFSNGPR
jgi:hypothetical protein